MKQILCTRCGGHKTILRPPICDPCIQEEKRNYSTSRTNVSKSSLRSQLTSTPAVSLPVNKAVNIRDNPSVCVSCGEDRDSNAYAVCKACRPAIKRLLTVNETFRKTKVLMLFISEDGKVTRNYVPPPVPITLGREFDDNDNEIISACPAYPIGTSGQICGKTRVENQVYCRQHPGGYTKAEDNPWCSARGGKCQNKPAYRSFLCDEHNAKKAKK